MKVYITNTCGIESECEIQNRIVSAGIKNDFIRLGIGKYSGSEDVELNSFIAGITSTIECGGVVVVQLPTLNGIDFDTKLIETIKKTKNAIVIALFHDVHAYAGAIIKDNVDEVICISYVDRDYLVSNSFESVKIHVCCFNNDTTISFISEKLLEIVNPYFNIMNNERMCMEYANDDNIVHICICVTDKSGSYCNYVSSTMLSVIEHTARKVWFHILIDETVSIQSKKRLILTAAEHGCLIDIKKVDVSEWNITNSWLGLYSTASLFRIMIPKLFQGIQKMIYLDADIFFHADVSELWDVELADTAIAGVRDIGFDHGIALPSIISNGHVERNSYFNSGVLIMNIDAINKKYDLLTETFDFLNTHPETFLPDQDALNFIFRNDKLLLDEHWNCFTKYERNRTGSLEKKVYHYAGEPFIAFYNPTVYDKEYLRLRSRTAWKNELIIDELYRGMGAGYFKIDMLQKLLKYSNQKDVILVFYGTNSFAMHNVINMLSPGEGDIIIENSSNPRNSVVYNLPKFDFSYLEKLKVGSYIVIVSPEAENGAAIRRLDSLGLKYGVDYFPVPTLLTCPQGGYLC